MKLAQLQDIPNKALSTSVTSIFNGYNHNARIGNGQMYDMQNMTSDNYPMLSPRDIRGFAAQLTNCTGLDGSEHLYWVDDNKLYVDTREVTTLTMTADYRQFVRMGALLCVFPDCIAYNTEDRTIITLNKEVSCASCTLSLCKMDGTVYDNTELYVGTTEPSHDMLWLDTSSDPVVLKEYSDNQSMWVSVPTTYVKIAGSHVGEFFNEDDAVNITGCDYDDFNTSMIIQAKGNDYIVVIGLLDVGTYTNTHTMTFSRKVPDMDFVCEYNNRLYGCSAANHEIYVSKLGDPANWNYFGGIASDSYAATIATDGKFTGAIAYGGYVLFFKERGVHKLYGTQPSNFQISWTALRGVEEGSERSLVIINESLYYKSVDGVCVYNGTMPTNIGAVFGTEKYDLAVGGAYKNKYYVSMRDRDFVYHLFVYDTEKGIWHIEDNVGAVGFASYEGGIYMCDKNNKLWVFPSYTGDTALYPGMSWDELYYYPSDNLFPGYSTTTISEDLVEWFAESGDLGLESPYEKYVTKIIVRMQMEESSEITISIMYDSSGEWEQLFNRISDCKKSFSLPLKVKRCDHYRLRIEGKGMTKIYSIATELERGSEV